MLTQLPTNLAFVVHASIVPVNVQLPALPQDLHSLAVHALFPEIASQGSLGLDVSVGTAAAIAALSASPAS